MKLIYLTAMDGVKRPINANRIAWMKPRGTGGGTRIYFSGLDDDYLPVKESLVEVERLIDTIWIKPRE